MQRCILRRFTASVSNCATGGAYVHQSKKTVYNCATYYLLKMMKNFAKNAAMQFFTVLLLQ